MSEPETGRQSEPGSGSLGDPISPGFHWRSRAGNALLVSAAVAPAVSVVLLAPGSPLLLAAVMFGTAVATLGLRLQERGWRAVGLRKPERPLNLAVSVAAALASLIVVGRLVRPWVRDLTGGAADLSAFRGIEGDPVALVAGLAVVWTVAAFGEELLMRGFLLNVLREAFGDGSGGEDRWGWGVALVTTSVLSGLGHAYQGPTGMVLTGILAAGFGAVYLVSGRNLWASILTHGLYDTAGFLVFFLGLGG